MNTVSAPGIAALALVALLSTGCDNGSSTTLTQNLATTSAPTPIAPSPAATNAALTIDGTGGTSVNPIPLAAALEAFPMGEITLAERAGVIFLREEEKLAADLLAFAASRWGDPLFAGMTVAERSNSDAVKLLMTRHGIYDPAAGKATGVFEDRGLQTLFDALRARVELSLIDALLVSAEVAEISLVDLASHTANVSDNPDILRVYELLTLSARNHLRAYLASLRQHGLDYKAQYLTSAALAAISTSAFESGN
ncbi:MAG: DUF2202 domain-containing protein [Thiotrichales bacterium]